jgi:hypothetical protein
MGSETSKALRARRREFTAQIERLIAQADQRSPIGSARRARIKESGRLARRRLRALTAAQESVAAIEIEVGLALLQAVEEGLSRNEAFELAGLSRHLGRRYVDLALAAQDRLRVAPSTDPGDGLEMRQSEPDRATSDAQQVATTAGRRR